MHTIDHSGQRAWGSRMPPDAGSYFSAYEAENTGDSVFLNFEKP